MTASGGPRTVLVTGGAGFIGTNFVCYLLHHTDVRVIVVDALTYAGQQRNVAAWQNNPRCQFIRGRVEDVALMLELCRSYQVETIVHLAAQTHVDRSIMDARPFLQSNVEGTVALLEAARRVRLQRFVHMSTDEVYGERLEGECAEGDAFAPSSPYAASKAAADCFVHAYVRTYGVPACVVRSCNVYGPYQFPEKLVPMSILCALHDEPIPLYGDGSQRRQWLYVGDVCRALWQLCQEGEAGQVYHLSSGQELSNRELVEKVLELLGKPRTLIRSISDRPGHDRRYALQVETMRQLGWRARVGLEEGLRRTVEWYIHHRTWWEPLWNGEYAEYRRQWYDAVLASNLYGGSA
ncbi:MAG: dTDP-glucose 4,6-dehydratase [Candidatus Kapabacteria bacterium]|nr:dTDP-glucose 4,6-dehydratase [Candidatus Kapabacteria bacterium]MDW8012414.1 dTDP-glucose 4,6-dehydratase [Bacteroidota bacterium]